MITLAVTIEDLDKIESALDLNMDDLRRAVAEAEAPVVILRLQSYPNQSGKPQPFKTARQRRFFFAALRSGRIVVPYRRTHQLAQGWFALPYAASRLDIANRNPDIAKLVMGEKGEQAAYHKGTWDTVNTVAKRIDAESVLEPTAVGAIIAWLAKQGLTE